MSIALPSCRIDWRPSRQLCAALLVLGVLASLGAWSSDLPFAVRCLLAPLAFGYACWLARREWRRPAATLEFDREALLMQIGSQRTELFAPRLRLRGALASIEARDTSGRRHVLLWSADTLPVSSRRQLRLRLGGQSAA